MRVFLTLVATLAIAVPAQASTYVYISTGETGEPIYSDQASPTARRIELPEFGRSRTSSAQQIDEMLRVANELADARKDREVERAARRKAAVQAVPPQAAPVYADRGYYYYGRPRHFPHAPFSPPLSPEAPVAPTSKTFRFTPKL